MKIIVNLKKINGKDFHNIQHDIDDTGSARQDSK